MRAFDIDTVAGLLVEKLVRRHPHVFADGEATSPAEVEQAWERIKAEERASRAASRRRGRCGDLLHGIPDSMPGELAADKVLARLRRRGLVARPREPGCRRPCPGGPRRRGGAGACGPARLAAERRDGRRRVQAGRSDARRPTADLRPGTAGCVTAMYHPGACRSLTGIGPVERSGTASPHGARHRRENRRPGDGDESVVTVALGCPWPSLQAASSAGHVSGAAPPLLCGVRTHRVPGSLIPGGQVQYRRSIHMSHTTSRRRSAAALGATALLATVLAAPAMASQDPGTTDRATPAPRASSRTASTATSARARRTPPPSSRTGSTAAGARAVAPTASTATGSWVASPTPPRSPRSRSSRPAEQPTTRIVFRDNDAVEYLQVGAGVLAGIVLAGAAAAVISRRNHRGLTPA